MIEPPYLVQLGDGRALRIHPIDGDTVRVELVGDGLLQRDDVLWAAAELFPGQANRIDVDGQGVVTIRTRKL